MRGRGLAELSPAMPLAGLHGLFQEMAVGPACPGPLSTLDGDGAFGQPTVRCAKDSSQTARNQSFLHAKEPVQSVVMSSARKTGVGNLSNEIMGR